MVYSPSSIYAVEEDEENPRWAKVIKHGNRLFLHTLCFDPPPYGARLIDVSSKGDLSVTFLATPLF